MNVITTEFPGNGDFVIELQAFNNCDTVVIQDTINVVINSAADLMPIDFVIFPNPSSDFIQVSGDFQEAMMSIYDMSGKRVLQQVIYSSELIHLDDLENGNYLIELGVGDLRARHQFLLQSD
ncbi:MAG: T9SS type A sorting domain-containing protein [Bacteroidota bacterium]